MASGQPIADFPAITSIAEDDLLVLVDASDQSESAAGTTVSATAASLWGSIVDATVSGLLTLTAAVSKLVPGATSFAIRNHADSRDNLLVTDAGDVTAHGAVVAGGTMRGPRLAGSVGTPPTVTGLATGVSGATLLTGGDNTQGTLSITIDNAGGTIATGTSLCTVTFDGGSAAYTQSPSVLAGPSNLAHAASISTSSFHVVSNVDISRIGGTYVVCYQAMGI